MKKNRNISNIILNIITVILLAVSGFSAYKLISYQIEAKKSAEEFSNLSLIINSPATPDISPYDRYAALNNINSDMAGWIKIENSPIDYPVMQTPDNPNYYLKHNFEKQYSKYGVPYVDANCQLDACDNVIIYGHHMKNDAMFSTLEKYSDYDYRSEHRFIKFDTLSEYNTYQVICAFKIDIDTSDFCYNKYINFSDENELQEFMLKAKSLALYEADIDVEFGDKLLTLSTCEYTYENGRFVVIAKKVEDVNN